MLNNRLYRRTAHFFSRGGFTLVELLVVIAIIAILAGVALGPITAGIKKAQQSGGVQSSKSLQLAEFQYSSDNNNVYPYASSIGAMVGPLYPTYISDFGMLIINGSGNTKYTGTTPTTGIVAGTGSTATSSFDFTYYAGSGTPGGITSSVPDGAPVVFSGATAALAVSNGGATSATTLTVDTTCPFGITGMAVCYKSGSASFINATSGAVTIVSPNYPAGYGLASFGSW